MNYQYYATKHNIIVYQKLEGKSTTYIYKEGKADILPSKVYIIPYQGRHTGTPVYYEFDATYKKDEVGYYYTFKNRKVHTKLKFIHDRPDWLGHGDIDLRFNVDDLVVMLNKDEGKILEVHHFIGCANPMHYSNAISYLSNYLKEQRPQ